MSTENPWKTLSTREIYRNSWFSVREDKVIRPDGSDGIYGVVQTRIATGACALTPEREIYLVGQYRYTTEVYSWEIPEGGTEGDEDPLACAQRELQEEAGVIARRWNPLGGEFHLSNCITSERGFLFLAEDLEETESSPDGTEVLEVKKVPLDECRRMVVKGEITDAMSVMGILLLDQHLRERDGGR